MVAAGAVASLVAVVASVGLPAAAGSAELRCRLVDARIDESSGVAAASFSDEVVFTHNDSGDGPRFFAVDARTCVTQATYEVGGAASVDWEDMAAGTAGDGTPVLYLADIGDGQATRSSVVVYEVSEPSASRAAGILPVRSKWTLTYPDGPRDAETLLLDPETGRPVIVSKDLGGGRSRAYRIPAAGSGVLEALTSLDVRTLDGGGLTAAAWAVTAGATSPDRRTVALRTYLAAWTWSASPGEPLAAVLARPPERLDLPQGSQSEALSFTRDGRGLWVTAEGTSAPLHLVPFTPGAAGPGVAPPSSAAAPVVPRGVADGPVTGPVVAGLGALVLAGLAVLGLVAWRRQRPRGR